MMRLVPLTLAAVVLCIAAAHADIVSLKDGSIIECKIIEQTVRNGKPVYIVELESGKRQRVDADKVAWVTRAKPSWIVRKENKEWYDKQVERRGKKLETKWQDNYNLGRQCMRKKGLESEAEALFRKAYDLRVKVTKETIKAHEALAKWLERNCGLFGLAGDHWAKAFDLKKAENKEEEKEKASDHYKLGKWAESKSLYDEAQQCYETCLVVDPGYKNALKGIERLKKLRDTLVNPKLFRTIKGQHADAVKAFASKQSGNGSYGADVREAGVQGLRGMTGLCTLANIGQWEFAGVDRPELSKKVPKEIEKGIDFLFKADPNPKKLRGKDLWGNIFTIHVCLRILQNRNLKKYQAQAKSKINECFQALLTFQGPGGGWMYYDFARKTGASFTGAALLIALVELKKHGVSVPDQIFDRGLQHLQKMKQQDGVWMYRTTVRQKVEGSQGRAGVCELALYKCGKGSQQAIQVAVENFFKYRNILSAVKGKRGTHMGTGGTAPYYFLYGHMWLSWAIKALDSGTRDKYMTKLRDLFLKEQESDGGFWDWPLTKPHKIYGAAMGAITLYNIGTVEPKGRTAKRR